MMNPFNFAKILFYRFIGITTSEEETYINNELENNKEANDLLAELRDKEKLNNEINLFVSFDVEKALQAIKHKRRKWFIFKVSSVACIFTILITIGLYNFNETDSNEYLISENYSKEIILENSSGVKINLDTIYKDTINSRIYCNEDGVLRIATNKFESEEIEINKISVPYAATYCIILNDETKVYLNSGSVIEFPTVFNNIERKVRIQGEAYFEVTSESERPFIVEVDDIAVHVLGTSFNVKSYPDEDNIYTTLVNGRVYIMGQTFSDLILEPNEQAVFNKNSKTVESTKVDTQLFTSWKDGLFYFKNKRLEEILKIIARWYDIEINYVGEDSRNVVFNGKIPMYEGIEDVLRKFEMSEEVKFDLNNKILMIYDK